MAIYFGIDLGGTKIEIIALDGARVELLRRRVPTPQGNYEATLAAIAELVHSAERQMGQTGTVGRGIPGAESAQSGLIKNANSTCLIGRPLRHDLQDLLKREVRLANDANCFALSEATDGAGAGASLVFGAILGTGVGGGMVVNGKVLVGANGIAGEWGHNRLPGDEAFWPQCYCGRHGCNETFLSGPGLTRDHERVTGQHKKPSEIADLAAQGDLACMQTLERYEERLARALAQVINVLDPAIIVLGGGLSNLDRLYENLPNLCSQHVFSDQISTQFLKNQHGDSSGVRGAAWLWLPN